MASAQINRILNANIYSSGRSLLGKAEEIQLPAIKAKFADLKVLGLQMDIEIPSGFEKMTGKVKWNAVYSDLITEFGSPYNTRQLQVRANLETYDPSGRIAQVPVVAFLSVRFKDLLPAITLKMGDNPEQESEFSCNYYRLEIDGVKLIEIDAFANTYFVNGQDQYQQYRISLGLN